MTFSEHGYVYRSLLAKEQSCKPLTPVSAVQWKCCTLAGLSHQSNTGTRYLPEKPKSNIKCLFSWGLHIIQLIVSKLKKCKTFSPQNFLASFQLKDVQELRTLLANSLQDKTALPTSTSIGWIWCWVFFWQNRSRKWHLIHRCLVWQVICQGT